MKRGFKVFDADADVIYPADLWPKYLDQKYVDRIGRKAPPGFDHYNPVTVDGRWSSTPRRSTATSRRRSTGPPRT